MQVNKSRKVFANEFWDDRAITLSHLSHPDEVKIFEE